MRFLRRWLTCRDVALVLFGAVVLLLAGAVDVLWEPSAESRGASIQMTLVIFLGSAGGLLITIGLSSFMAIRAMMDAITATMGQNPEFVREYLKPGIVMDLLKNNLEVRTNDRQFSEAVSRDLLGVFLSDKGTRIRTSQKYSVRMKYCQPGELAAKGSGQPAWIVQEELYFDERMPFVLQEKSTVAAFVFCESALDEWFQPGNNCMYRSVAYLPEDLTDPEQISPWLAENLTCEIKVGDHQLELEPVPELDGNNREKWVLRFVLVSAQNDLEALVDDACDEAPGTIAQVRVWIHSRMTFSAQNHSYTTYLAYPTLDPETEFRIEGPVCNLECARFYNLGLRSEVVDRLDSPSDPKHIKIRLSGQRWVFPVSGAVFSWDMIDGRCVDPGSPFTG